MGRPIQPWRTAAAVAVVLVAFAALSYSAAATKNATIDEPTHLAAGWVALTRGDYRVEVANPALWKMAAAVPDAALPLRPAAGGPLARDVGFAPEQEVAWCSRALFASPGVDGDRAVRRARAVMLAASVALAAVTALWAYQLAGRAAALTATCLFVLDPTVLAHAPLVKSDMAVGLMLVLLGWLTWHAGRRPTAARVVGLGVVCGLAVNVKFSGLLAGPILAALLLLRAAGRQAWPVPGGVLTTRVGRVVGAVLIGTAAAVVCVGVTWACYRFRYRPAPSPAVAIDTAAVADRVRGTAASARLGRPATAAEVAAEPPGRLLRFVAFADRHHLLPQAYLAGLAYQSAYVSLWPAYLDGTVYLGGRPSYFPLAAAYKTPVAELAALALAAGLAPIAAWQTFMKRRLPVGRSEGAAVVGPTRTQAASGAADSGGQSFWGGRATPSPFSPTRRTEFGWAAACVAVPALAFGASALAAGLNIGLRTALPFYPFAAVAVGCVTAWAGARRPRLTFCVAVFLLGCQLSSVGTAWPDYIPFFNAFVGGPEAGLAHLADSNLDWGQDVRALADWQRAHPAVPVYADLFLSVDPAVYGLHCRWIFEPDAAGHMRLNLPDGPAVLAVSATHLVGLNVTPEQRRFLVPLLNRRPREVLHGTIYLYDYRP